MKLEICHKNRTLFPLQINIRKPRFFPSLLVTKRPDTIPIQKLETYKLKKRVRAEKKDSISKNGFDTNGGKKDENSLPESLASWKQCHQKEQIKSGQDLGEEVAEETKEDEDEHVVHHHEERRRPVLPVRVPTIAALHPPFHPSPINSDARSFSPSNEIPEFRILMKQQILRVMYPILGII